MTTAPNEPSAPNQNPGTDPVATLRHVVELSAARADDEVAVEVTTDPDTSGGTSALTWGDLRYFRAMVDELPGMALKLSGILEALCGEPTTVQWAVRVVKFDGSETYEPANDQEHAHLIADGRNEHLATLNEPTRTYNGVARVEVVYRNLRRMGTSALVEDWRRPDDPPSAPELAYAEVQSDLQAILARQEAATVT